MILLKDKETVETDETSGFWNFVNFHTISLSHFAMFLTFFAFLRLNTILHNILAFTPVKTHKTLNARNRLKWLRLYVRK